MLIIKSAYFSKFKFSKKILGKPPLDVLCQTLDLYDKYFVNFFSLIGEFAKIHIDIGVKLAINLNFFMKSFSEI